MANTPLSKKLGIKPGHKLLILNAPTGFLEMLGALPSDVQLQTKFDGPVDVILAFAHDRAEVELTAPTALRAFKAGGALWFAYPKKSAKVKTDISRDVGWDLLTAAGFRIVSQVAIDEIWGVGRFRPLSEVNVK